MGACLGSPERNHDAERLGIAVGKSQPLQQRLPTWRADTAMTDRELAQKRRVFWETAPAFEGRQEIWQALKAACEAAESKDFDLAQAIVDGASISLPTGMLTDAYDELGNRYVVPLYCLSLPSNIARDGAGVTAEAAPSAAASTDAAMTTNLDLPGTIASGGDITLKFRLSTLKDVKLTVKSMDTVAVVKHKLGRQEGIDGRAMRLFLSGKQLSDKLVIEKVKIPKGFFIQALVPS